MLTVVVADVLLWVLRSMDKAASVEKAHWPCSAKPDISSCTMGGSSDHWPSFGRCFASTFSAGVWCAGSSGLTAPRAGGLAELVALTVRAAMADSALAQYFVMRSP